jgi:antitoxin HicB
MAKKKTAHIGSTFESWLDETGLREEVTRSAIKSVARRFAAEKTKRPGAVAPPEV